MATGLLALAHARRLGLPEPQIEAWQADAKRMARAAALMAASDIADGVLRSAREAERSGLGFDAWKVAMLDVLDRGTPGGSLRGTPEGSPAEVEVKLPAAVKTAAWASTSRVTLMQLAWNQGRHQLQMANIVARPILLYSAINDGAAREAHVEMSGFMAPAGDPVWAVWYPPNGYNCRCYVISLTLDQALARGYKAGDLPPIVFPDDGFGGSVASTATRIVDRWMTAKIGSLSTEIAVGLDTANRKD